MTTDWKEALALAARNAGLAPRVDRFFFLRHGETEHNRRHIVQGWTDIPLNFTGEQQAEAAARLIRGQGATHMIASPLLRARRTAEIVSASTGIAIKRLDLRLREKSFGEYENHPDPTPSVWTRLDKGAESYEEFAARCIAGFNDALAEGLPLVVAHGGVRRILLWGLELEQKGIHMGNAVPLEFTRVNGSWRVHTMLAPAG